MDAGNDKREYAFIDESGDLNLNLASGASSLFVVVAILVNANQRESGLEKIELIKKNHFSGSEIKSSGVGSNATRRQSILEAIAQLDFSYYATVIVKSEIDQTSGLQYKRSAFKFINGQLYRKLYRLFAGLNIIADEHGTAEFQESFRNYIEKNHTPDLFAELCSVATVTSESEPWVQIADFVAGTLARGFAPGASEEERAFRDVIKSKELHIQRWPPTRPHAPKPVEDESPFDAIVGEFAMNQALLFLESHGDSEDEERQWQSAVIRYLLDVYEFGDVDRFTFTGILQDHLQRLGFEEMSQQQFRSKVIGRLRDAGVILASGNKGYKIPTSMKDMHEFLAHDRSIITPMLHRMRTARNELRLTSKGELDILADYPDLKSVVDAYEDNENFS